MYFSAEERGKVRRIKDIFPYVKKPHPLFVQVRQENPNFAVGQIGKELGRRWAEADPEVGN